MNNFDNEVPELTIPNASETTSNRIWRFLHEMQIAFKKMMWGTWQFLCQTLPLWLYELLYDVVRISVKAVKVALIASLWLTMVFGVGIACSVLGLLGNVWVVTAVVLLSAITVLGSFRALARLRSRTGGVTCVWVVGVTITLIYTGLLIDQHIKQARASNSTTGNISVRK
jgi:hypothetical protein